MIELLESIGEGLSEGWTTWKAIRLQLLLERLDGHHLRGAADSWPGIHAGDMVTERRLQLRLHGLLYSLQASFR